ncbi:hypothetical protein CBL_08390 [Carabus blaptoides fortunei]
MAALQIIANDVNEKPSTRSEASGLLISLDSMETCFLSLLWNDILDRFNKVSQSLQSEVGFLSIMSHHLSRRTHQEESDAESITSYTGFRGFALTNVATSSTMANELRQVTHMMLHKRWRSGSNSSTS